MSLEALDTIALAEEKARQIRAAAQAEAKRAVQEAEDTVTVMMAAADGKAESEIKDLIRKADEKAGAEIKELIRKADEKAKEDAGVLASTTRNRQAAMKARADRKMDQVVDKIVERIVNG